MALESFCLFCSAVWRITLHHWQHALNSLILTPFKRSFIAPRQKYVSFSSQAVNYIGHFYSKVIVTCLWKLIFETVIYFTSCKAFLKAYLILGLFSKCHFPFYLFCFSVSHVHKITGDQDKSSHIKRKAYILSAMD